MHIALITAVIALQTALLVILASRRLYLRYALFFSFNLVSILVALARTWTMSSPNTFFATYWSTQAVYSILALMIVVAVSAAALDVWFARYKWGRAAFVLALLTIALLTVWQAIHHPLNHSYL